MIRQIRAPGFTVLVYAVVILSACTPAPAGAPLTPTPDWHGERLPAPTGPYAVGFRTFWIEDTGRDEPHTASGTDTRAFQLRVVYPAAPADAAPGPYLDPAIAQAYGLDEASNRWLGHAVLDAPLAQTGGTLPVLVWSAGFTAMPPLYSALIEDLASHGYVVAVPAHPYTDQYALLPDGSVVEYPGDRAFVEAWGGEDPYNAELYRAWVPDIFSVLAWLEHENVAEFAGRLSLERFGFAGHSFGGSAAAEACRLLEARCAGAANLDGGHSAEVEAAGLAAPYLYLAASGTRSADLPEVRAVFSRSTGGAALAEIDGTTHLSFTDGAYLAEARGTAREGESPYGTLEPERALVITRAYLLAFFDAALRGEPSVTLESLSGQYPEATVQTRPAGD